MIAQQQKDEIELVPPEGVRVNGRQTRVGGVVYRAVKCLVAGGGSVSLSKFTRDVWGRTEVNRDTVSSAVFRVNGLLRAGASTRRAALTGDVVRFE